MVCVGREGQQLDHDQVLYQALALEVLSVCVLLRECESAVMGSDSPMAVKT